MARVLVLGASGAIGRFLLPRLAAAEFEVLALSRVARADSEPGPRWLVGDLGASMPSLPALDAIFSLGPLDAFARWFAQAPALRPARVVAVGSMSVESKRDSSDAGERALAQRLVRAEQELALAAAARGCALSVLRPTLIYGAGVDRSLTPFARFARRWRVFPRVIGACGLRQPVHAEDLADACLAVLGHPATGGRTYALGGGERLSFEAMLERVRASLPVRTVPLPVPLPALRGIAALAPALGLPAVRAAAIQRLTRDLVAEHAAAVADFGWAPRGFRP